MTQIQKWPKLKNELSLKDHPNQKSPKLKINQIKKLPKFKNDPKSKMTKNQ